MTIGGSILTINAVRLAEESTFKHPVGHHGQALGPGERLPCLLLLVLPVVAGSRIEQDRDKEQVDQHARLFFRRHRGRRGRPCGDQVCYTRYTNIEVTPASMGWYLVVSSTNTIDGDGVSTGPANTNTDIDGPSMRGPGYRIVSVIRVHPRQYMKGPSKRHWGPTFTTSRQTSTAADSFSG